MKDLVPLAQTMVWPVMIGLVVLLNRQTLRRIVTALTERIEQAASLKAGGVEIAAAPSLPAVSAEEADPRQIDKLPHEVYIVHTARRDRSLDKGGQEFYRIRIFLDAETPEHLAQVAEVTYRLHPTFRDPVRKVTDPTANFELRTAGWGEFNMTAEISFKNGPSIVVERYINLPGSVA